MLFQSFTPNPILSGIVKFYWVLKGSDVSTQKIIPDGCPELIFHFGQPYQIKKLSGKFERQSACLAAGQLVNPIFLRPEGESGIVAVKFQPQGFWQLFGINMQSLTNDTIDGIHVENAFPELSLQIYESISDAERISIIENFLLKQQVKKRPADLVAGVVGEIVRSKGEISVGRIAKHHHISERHLQRRFNEVVGVSPKHFARIIRYKNVCSLISDPTLTLTDAVYLAGYFDQPHFNKDFAEFTWENPNEYLSHNHFLSKIFMSNS